MLHSSLRCPFHFDFVRHPLKNTPSDPLGFSFFLTLPPPSFKIAELTNYENTKKKQDKTQDCSTALLHRTK